MTALKNLIEETLIHNIQNQNTIFVFPTQTAADLWADRATEITSVSAVAMERFIAWDDFKGSSIKSQQKNKKSIPSTMRKIFTAQLLSENAKTPFFKSIINPSYAKNSSGFINWISGLLPCLAIWKKHFESSSAQKNPDAEDEDLLKLYSLYSDFLNKHNLFDPAWEKPPFYPDGNHYFIFFPDILSDYAEYKNLLENSPDDITTIHLPKENQYQPSVDFFDNSRTELKAVAMKIRELHIKNNIAWNQICISVPDMDSYGPYLERELELFEIPHVLRHSKPLAASGAGNFFLQAQECVNSDFSFESIKNLLLNTELPWLETQLSRDLITFGQDNNCICSFEYKNKKIDVWEESFKDKPTGENVKNYYFMLKEKLTALVHAKSFEEVRQRYFEFRNKYFNMDNCPVHTDRLISRCISELGALIDLERDFPECTVSSPFSFFVQQLNEASYLAQTDELGVMLLPYKTAAVAPFACHVVVDSSQSSLSVVYKQLSFLREDKRRELLGGADDPNVTDLFIQLYAINSTSGNYYFSAASKTFTGYAQSSSYLVENNCTGTKEQPVPSFLSEDFYTKEKNFLHDFSPNSDKLPEEITQIEKTGFNFWEKCYPKGESDKTKSIELISTQIKEKRYVDGKIIISPTHLKSFFKCRRQWLIHYMIKLEPQENEAELLSILEMGDLYHRILELFCKSLHKLNKPLHQENGVITDEYKEILKQSIDIACHEDKFSFLSRQLLQTTNEALYVFMLNTVNAFSSFYEGYSVYKNEYSINYLIPEKNVLCNGTVDCLLKNPADGDCVLVDFKSSKNSIPKNLYLKEEQTANQQKEELPDFQMPMYLYILQHMEKPIEINECCFFNIKDGLRTSVDLDRMPSVISKMLDCIDIYAEYITQNDFTAEPQQDFTTCYGCKYRAVCRKIFTVGKSE